MLAETNKIDVVSTDRDVRLSLVIEPGEWANPERLWLLQDKANAYAAYALDGQMIRDYPRTKGLPVEIAIVPAEPAPPDVLDFIPRLRAALAPDGIAVELRPQYQAAA